ncbi:hypothetical protein [Nitrosarchaeum koreense]|uniref:Uncharacterized protein n=1 Tax=Nitrosarchaeum koreense MY1 TaxID=1001994 RepID=F9CU85_9ARCH|nr:hypothetical protein [Nitrosarchaeum koreense]EGP94286.1 hypothetical protein MY1_1532 [Nitrosarchaeum koreense MY1]
MATSLVYVVFVLPIVLSIAFGTVVMADVLQSPDRELNMWPMGNSEIMKNDEDISIIGLENQYSISSPVQIQVKIDDSQFDCGDLYVTVYSGKHIVTQSGFLKQCFDENNSLLPIDDDFSEIIDKPGQYDLVVKMTDQNQKNTITTSGKFTIK